LKKEEKAMYEMKLRSVGNPDFGQYAPLSEPEVVTGETLSEMRARCEAYIRKWNLGGGNWVNPIIREVVPGRKTKKAVGYFSYNGRLWKGSPKTWSSDIEQVEIQVEVAK
jgi:hypothetical protein